MKNVVNEPIATYNQEHLRFSNYSGQKKLGPVVKWAGGKENELKYILPQLPSYFNRYFEPFVGGGAVFTAIQAQEYHVNDKSTELINLYRSIKSPGKNGFFTILHLINNIWEEIHFITLKHGNRLLQLYDEFINQNRSIEDVSRQYAETLISELPSIQEIAGDLDVDANQLYQKELIVNAKRKLIRVSNLEKEKGKLESDNLLENIETIFKSSFYMVVRQLHNMCKAKNGYYPSAYFLFIRNFAYSGMFRYNAKGGFNVPYGGIAYNSKNFYKKITYLQSDALSALLSRTDIENMDFEDFLTTRAPNKNDFVFLDPPYDTTFSTYAMNPFCEQDQKRLAKYLISNCKAKWMLVIKNTELISMLYDHPSLYITSFDKKYQVSFMNRNNKNAKHLIIRNYPNGE